LDIKLVKKWTTLQDQFKYWNIRLYKKIKWITYNNNIYMRYIFLYKIIAFEKYIYKPKYNYFKLIIIYIFLIINIDISIIIEILLIL